MNPSSIRILVVEDYEPFRQFVIYTLRNLWEPQEIREVSDGLAAVHEAQTFQPDLILLDVGLPTLNGLEAARQIRKFSPTSKIVFVSQESSIDFVQEAFAVGAFGYVVKTDAGSELLAAVTAALRGERFVGSRFAGHHFTGAANLQRADVLFPNTVHGSPTPTTQKAEIVDHQAHFYSDDESFLVGMTRFIGSALKEGSAVIVPATPSHLESLLARLQIYGTDVSAAVEQGRYIPLDVSRMLSTFMVNDLPDPVRFMRTAVDLIMTTAKAVKGESRRVVACGECASVLWQQGNAEAAIQLERLWDQVGRRYQVPILCTYPLGSFQEGMGSRVFEKIRAEHSIVHSR